MDKKWECIVIGGGAAGLSAALVLGRARRRTLVVDAGQQSNLPAHGIGGLLGHDGRSPAELYQMGRDELRKYPAVEFRRATVVKAGGEDGHFDLELDDGTTETSRKVILAGGMEYRYDQLPGAEELWGDTVFHCPFCHGWEVAGKPLAVRANGERALHGLLLRAWTDDVVVLTGGPAELDDEQRRKLAAADVAVDERQIEGLLSKDGKLTAISFSDGSRLERAGLLVSPKLHQRGDLAAQLGVKAADPDPMKVDAIPLDGLQRTTIPGVFAAGDLGMMPQVATAIASGSIAGVAVVQGLMGDEFGLPVPPRS